MTCTLEHPLQYMGRYDRIHGSNARYVVFDSHPLILADTSFSLSSSASCPSCNCMLFDSGSGSRTPSPSCRRCCGPGTWRSTSAPTMAPCTSARCHALHCCCIPGRAPAGGLRNALAPVLWARGRSERLPLSQREAQPTIASSGKEPHSAGKRQPRALMAAK
jgi:hypothetical protein